MSACGEVFSDTVLPAASLMLNGHERHGFCQPKVASVGTAGAFSTSAHIGNGRLFTGAVVLATLSARPFLAIS